MSIKQRQNLEGVAAIEVSKAFQIGLLIPLKLNEQNRASVVYLAVSFFVQAIVDKRRGLPKALLR